MKKIDIKVNKAQILRYSVTLGEEEPQVSATIGLFAESGKMISEYSISTDSWQGKDKFVLPMGIEAPIIDIMKKLEVVVVKHMNSEQKQLSSNPPF